MRDVSANPYKRISLLKFAVIALTLAALSCSMAPVWADGLANKGHICGPNSTLLLNSAQIKTLDTKSSKHPCSRSRFSRSGYWPQITLTNEQVKDLAAQSGISTVKRLTVLPANVQTCTCELYDVAIRVSQDKIEVADYLLDRDAKKSIYQIQKEQEEADLNKFPPSPEAILVKNGKSFELTNPEKSVEIYLLALNFNPNFKWAKYHLADAYEDMGRRAMCRFDHERAAIYLDLAIKYSLPEFKAQRKEIVIAQKRTLELKNSRRMRDKFK